VGGASFPVLVGVVVGDAGAELGAGEVGNSAVDSV
jgi:hypothetical protein